MMKKDVVEIIDQLREYITNDVFKDEGTFVRNIRVVKFNTELEWFNCALIGMCNFPSNRIVVNTLQGWDYVLGSEVLNKPLGNSSPVKLLKPVYDRDNNTLQFTLIDTYYIDQLEGFVYEKVKYVRESSIGRIIDKKENYEDIKRILKNGWQDIFIESYLKLFDFYYLSNKERRSFYKNLLKYVFGEELGIETPQTLSSLKVEKEHKITLYKQLHELISCFHIAFQSYIDELDDLQKEIGVLTIEQPRLRSDAYQMMEKMSKGVSLKEQEEEQSLPDESSQK